MNQQQQVTIPTEAFSQAECWCGGQVFQKVTRFKFYQGVLSAGACIVAEEPTFYCVRCSSVLTQEELFKIKPAVNGKAKGE